MTTVPEDFQTRLDTVKRQVHLAISQAEGDDPVTMMTVTTPALTNTLLALVGDVSSSRRMLIRRLRNSGYTLREVADVVGLSHQRVSQIEAGETTRDVQRRRKQSASNGRNKTTNKNG